MCVYILLSAFDTIQSAKAGTEYLYESGLNIGDECANSPPDSVEWAPLKVSTQMSSSDKFSVCDA